MMGPGIEQCAAALPSWDTNPNATGPVAPAFYLSWADRTSLIEPPQPWSACMSRPTMAHSVLVGWVFAAQNTHNQDGM